MGPTIFEKMKTLTFFRERLNFFFYMNSYGKTFKIFLSITRRPSPVVFHIEGYLPKGRKCSFDENQLFVRNV